MKTVKRPTTEEIADGQREYQRKWESGEFMREANAAKRRIEQAAPDLLKACRRALSVLKGQGESVRPGNVLGALEAAIAKAEGK